MTAFSVVRFRVKPSREQEFLDAHRRIEAGWSGLVHANMIKTGERTFCIVAEWTDMEALAKGHPNMIATLDSFRDTLEDPGGGLRVTDSRIRSGRPGAEIVRMLRCNLNERGTGTWHSSIPSEADHFTRLLSARPTTSVVPRLGPGGPLRSPPAAECRQSSSVGTAASPHLWPLQRRTEESPLVWMARRMPAIVLQTAGEFGVYRGLLQNIIRLI
ncbi:MAG: hypothetical protein WAN86_08305 [Hyphomicrobiaceae bacterium]